jgi:tripartite-type tricarboxylate transporter receptor subunit TctC
VPYRGGGPQLNDLISGQVQSGFVAISVVAPYVEAGNLRALAVLNGVRSPLLPDTPTLEEEGIHGIDVSQWRGIMAPSGTPRDSLLKLTNDFSEAFTAPEVKAALAKVGEEPLGAGPEEFGKFIQAEITKYREWATRLNISLD